MCCIYCLFVEYFKLSAHKSEISKDEKKISEMGNITDFFDGFNNLKPR